MSTPRETTCYRHPCGRYSLVQEDGLYVAAAKDRADLARWATEHGYLITWDAETDDPLPGGLPDASQEGAQR